LPDHLLIYVIVALNALCQATLVWRLKFASSTKWKFCSAALAVPLVIMVAMRLLIASGSIHGRVADQSLVEQLITKGAGILLIAGPWLVTISAVMYRRRQRQSVQMQPAE